MTTLFKSWIVRVVALLFAASVTFAQAFAQDRAPFRQAELDQMLAPVALYPDSLLSQVLMASTYPLEVVQAARWSRANPGLRGQDAVYAVGGMDWDPSVKSLTAFPQILTQMDEHLEWTERLGEAFLVQQADVMDSVQALRRRAEAAGNLRSNEQMRVTRQGEVIYILQPAPEIVYVPYYNPVVVFGPWWWPAYPPFYWAPPVAYYFVPAHRTVFLWSPGIVISTGFFFGHCDWQRRHVTVVQNHITHVTVNRNIAATSRPVAWQHDSVHRRGAPFRHAEVRERFEPIRAINARRDASFNDAAQAGRRTDDHRPADIRPRQREEHRDTVREQRDDRREQAVNRVTPGNNGNRADQASANRNVERLRSAASSGTRITQPDRSAPHERSAPQANDRHAERRDAPRSPARGTEPQPVAVVPVARTLPRPADPAAATTHTAARKALDGDRRAVAPATPQQNKAAGESSSAARAAPAPQPAAAPARASRMESQQQQGNVGAQPQGNGNQRGEGPAIRDSNRKS